MDVFDAVRTDISVRQYKDTPVPQDVTWRIVEAARLTASSMNAQPWHFIVVEDKNTIQQLGSLAKTGPYIAQAPLAVVVTVDKNSKFGVSDGSRAIQSMILTAWSEGVGSNWVGFVGGLEAIKPVLNIPDSMEVLAIVPFGYPAQPTGRGKKNRKSLSQVASLNKYSQPFEQ